MSGDLSKHEKEAAKGFRTHHIQEYKPQVGFRQIEDEVDEDEGSVGSCEKMSGVPSGIELEGRERLSTTCLRP